MRNRYHVRYTKKCIAKLQEIGTLEQLDPVLSKLEHDLSIKPYEFPLIPDRPNWGIATTGRHYKKGSGLAIPGLRFYFAIVEQRMRVWIIDVKLNFQDRALYM